MKYNSFQHEWLYWWLWFVPIIPRIDDHEGGRTVPRSTCSTSLKGGQTIIIVYIDDPCEFLIRRSMDRLLAEHFLKFPGPIVLQPFEFGNSSAQPLFHSLFQNAQVKHRLIFKSHMVQICILYLWVKRMHPALHLSIYH